MIVGGELLLGPVECYCWRREVTGIVIYFWKMLPRVVKCYCRGQEVTVIVTVGVGVSNLKDGMLPVVNPDSDY